MAVLPKSFYTRNDVVRISRELLGKFVFTRVRNRVAGGMIVETEAYAGARDRASHAYGNRRTKRTEVMFHEGGIAYVYFCYGMHSLLNVVTNVEGIPDAVLIRAILPTEGIPTMLRRRGKKALAKSLEGVEKQRVRLATRLRAVRYGVAHRLSKESCLSRIPLEGEAELSRWPSSPHCDRSCEEIQSVRTPSPASVRMLRTLAAGPGTLTKALGIDYCSFNGRSLAGPEIWIEDRGVKVKASDIVAGPRVGVDYAGPDAKRPWRFRLNRELQQPVKHQDAKVTK